MDPKNQVLARIAELDVQHAEIKGKRSALLDTAIAEKRGLSDEQKTEFDGLDTELRGIAAQLKMSQERLAEIEADDAREARAAGVRVAPAVGGAQVNEPAIYRADNAHEVSYFKDLYRAQLRGDFRAAERLSKNASIEQRALTTVATDGGEFAPPLWLVSEYVKFARATRVAIDLFDVQPLPSGISSINLPKVTTGTTVGIHTENGAVTNTDLVTASLNTDITTVAGAQTVSLQLMEQSATPFDRVVLEDLAGAHAVELNRQSHAGNGTTELRGLTSAAGKTVVTWTDATPTGGEFLLQVASAANSVHSNRFLPADAVVMHPRRWGWLTSRIDSTGRPLAGVKAGAEFNPLASGDPNVALGFAGTILGIPVYLDATIPVTLGAGTEDRAYVLHRQDIKVWESPVKAEAFRETFADTMSLYFRLYNYSAMIPDRYGSSVVEISGTGMIAPNFTTVTA